MSISARLDKWITFWLSKKVLPVDILTLDRRRIYIIPSRLGAGVIVMALALFLFGTNYQNNLILLLSFFVFSAFVIMMHVSHFNLSGLKLKVTPAKPVAYGEPLLFSVLALNKHQELGASVSASVPSRIKPKEGLAFVWSPQRNGRVQTEATCPQLIDQCTVPFAFTPKQRGMFQPRWLKVTSYAPMGFFRVWAVMRTDAQSWVYPKPIAGPLPLAQAQMDEAANTADAEQDWQQLNEYQPGDSLSRMYWRRFALNRELWVRGASVQSPDELPELPDDVVLHIDSPVLRGMDKEQRLSVLAHWVIQLSQQHKRFALKLHAQQLAMGSGHEHQWEALKCLALA